MTCDHNFIVEGTTDDFQRLVCDKCGAERPADRAYRQLVAFYDARYRAAVTNAMLSAYIKTDNVRLVCGYDPQKLLPSPEKARPLTGRQWADAFHANFAEWAKEAMKYSYMDFERHSLVPMISSRDVITGRYIPYTESRWGEGPSDPVADLAAFRDRIMHPDVPIRHKVAVVKVTDLDFSEIEARVMASMSDRRVRAIIIDVDREDDLPGRGYDFATHKKSRQAGILAGLELKQPKTVATAAGKRDMGYLKHDRTKSHKRRRR